MSDLFTDAALILGLPLFFIVLVDLIVRVVEKVIVPRIKVASHDDEADAAFQRWVQARSALRQRVLAARCSGTEQLL